MNLPPQGRASTSIPKTLDKENGSGYYFSASITQSENGKDKLIDLHAHARNKKGYNAARGWIACSATIHYFDFP